METDGISARRNRRPLIQFLRRERLTNKYKKKLKEEGFIEADIIPTRAGRYFILLWCCSGVGYLIRELIVIAASRNDQHS